MSGRIAPVMFQDDPGLIKLVTDGRQQARKFWTTIKFLMLNLPDNSGKISEQKIISYINTFAAWIVKGNDCY